MGFYNPRSASRPHQFARVLEILREECEWTVSPSPAPSPRRASNPHRHAGEATPEMADMRTVVLVGNSATRRSVAGSTRRVPPEMKPAHHLLHLRQTGRAGTPAARS
jgi:precorrin-3B methylase